MRDVALGAFIAAMFLSLFVVICVRAGHTGKAAESSQWLAGASATPGHRQ